MEKIDPYLLNLAGEYRVCSELNKRGLFATMTYGNRKSADVYVIPDRPLHALRIEVKTGQGKRFVTGITQKGLARSPDAPDFWVLFLLRPLGNGQFEERFFVLAHKEICRIQRKVNRGYAKRFRKKYGRKPNEKAGVDNVGLEDVKAHEGQWGKILTSVEH